MAKHPTPPKFGDPLPPLGFAEKAFGGLDFSSRVKSGFTSLAEAAEGAVTETLGETAKTRGPKSSVEKAILAKLKEKRFGKAPAVPGEQRVPPVGPQLPEPISPQQRAATAGVLSTLLQSNQSGFKGSEIKQMAIQALLEPRRGDRSSLSVRTAPASTSADRVLSPERKAQDLQERKVALQEVALRLFQKARSAPDMRAAAMGSEIPVDWLAGDLGQTVPKAFRGMAFNFNDLTADEAALLITLTPGWEDFMHAERMTQGLPTRPTGFDTPQLTDVEGAQQTQSKALDRLQTALVPSEGV